MPLTPHAPDALHHDPPLQPHCLSRTLLLPRAPLPPPSVSVILAYFVSSDGSSNWLLGLQLVCTYVLIAVVFLLELEPKPAPH